MRGEASKPGRWLEGTRQKHFAGRCSGQLLAGQFWSLHICGVSGLLSPVFPSLPRSAGDVAPDPGKFRFAPEGAGAGGWRVTENRGTMNPQPLMLPVGYVIFKPRLFESASLKP